MGLITCLNVIEKKKNFLPLPGVEPSAVPWSLHLLRCTGQCLGKPQELVPHARTWTDTVGYATTSSFYQ